MQRVRLRDITVAFEARGQGAPLVLIHGGFVSMRSWREQIHHFSKTHRVVRFDLRGHGQTTRSSGVYSVPRFAEDVESLLEHLDMGSFFCWGHSLGGMIAQELARRDDERVRGLILADTTYTTNRTLSDKVATAMSRAVWGVSSVQQIGAWASRHMGGRSPEVGAYVREYHMELARSRDTAHTILASVFRHDARPWLHELRCP
ncbi:MAG: alpha/beta fold hydrolase, partial [Myxococcota bacterium]